MKQIEVFDGNELKRLPVEYPIGKPICALFGMDDQGQRTMVPLDEQLLSRHLMLLGGIGTGNAQMHFTRSSAS